MYTTGPDEPRNPNPHPIHTKGARLGREITELCGYLFAGTYRLLVLIREFDEERYWHGPGLCSCAHWLNFQCGIGMNAAREKVRVAHALAKLPRISAAFARGEISYSKVRAMTRIADAANEEYLMMIARHGTAHHVEKLVSKYRRCKRLQETATANAQYRARHLSCRYDGNGEVVPEARLPPEQGALVMKALELAMERRRAEDREAGRKRPRSAFAAEQADALAEIAESYLNAEAGTAQAADRYQVVLHVSAETLKGVTAVTSDAPARSGRSDSCVTAETCGAANRPMKAGRSDSIARAGHPGNDCERGVTAETSTDGPATDVTAETSPHINAGISHLEDGPHVCAETSRRLACDCSRVALIEDDDGEPLSIGRKSRSIPPAIRRALKSRDGGCRFPGCSHKRYVDGHHIRHWADGGETSLENLVQLCRYHHRLVHEGGFSCERLPDGRLAFRDRWRQILTNATVLPAIDERHEDAWIKARLSDLDIDEETCVPQWYAGDRMDWDLGIWHLFQLEERAARQPQRLS
jgi:hypothetical protein